jgi:hypothetical protein
MVDLSHVWCTQGHQEEVVCVIDAVRENGFLAFVPRFGLKVSDR